jgi:hypothetical protein
MSPLVDVREGLNVTKAASSSAPRVFEVRDVMHDVLNDSALGLFVSDLFILEHIRSRLFLNSLGA